MPVGRTLWNRRISMRDGTELAADVVLPQGEGPWPAVVNRTPYMRGRTLREGFWPRLVDHGYAFVSVDVRGRGDSDGEFVPFAHDADDGHDTVEWAAAQSWCTGRVGMVGSSYEALTQWWAAKGKPAHLRCIVPQAVGAASLGPRTNCDTGVPYQYWIWWFNLVSGRTLQHPSSPSWGATFDHLPLRDLHEHVGAARDWWPRYLSGEVEYLGPAHVLSADDWDDFVVPTLVGVGWWDDQATMANWLALRRSPAAHEARLLIGGWDHAGNEGPRPALGGLDVSESVIDVLGYIERFLALHLEDGSDDDREPLPRCRVFRTGAMEWEELDDWPTAKAVPLSWHLGAGGTLSREAGSESGADSYEYDPAEPARELLDLDSFAWSDPPLDRRYLMRREDVLTYTSDPLEGRIDVSGRASFEGFVSIDAPDTDLAVNLYDVHPDGRSILLGATVPPPLLRLAFRNGPIAEPLAPGEVVRVDMPVIWLHHSFLPGHRIRLTITSSAVPMFARNLNGGEPWPDAVEPRVVSVTVHRGGRHRSRLLLPVELDTA